jgi:hypothetical protein
VKPDFLPFGMNSQTALYFPPSPRNAMHSQHADSVPCGGGTGIETAYSGMWLRYGGWFGVDITLKIIFFF